MAEKTNKALVATTAIAAAAGCIASWSLYNQWHKICREKERSLTDHANDINPEDLAILARSGNYALKKSAEQVMADRMVSEKNLDYLLQQCVSENQTKRKKATSVLSILSKTREFKPMLLKKNAFDVLYRCIKEISGGFQVAKLSESCYLEFEIEQTLKFSVVAILDLVSESEANLQTFFKSCKELVAFFLELICDPSDSISTDVRRLSILILQQMMQHEHMRCNLISYGMIQRISLCFLRTIGDAWLSRNCLQILVMHINLFEDYVTEEFLQEMAQLGIIPVLVGCLKSEDPDLIYWSTALLHEFLLKDLHRGVISKIPNLVKTLYQILVSSESSLQRLLLRIYCFLSINDDNFKKKLLNFKPLLKRLSICLASGNSDLLYWSLLLVHDLAMMGKQAALKMIKANEDLLKSVMMLVKNTLEGPCDIKLVAETLGFFCSCESLHKKAVDAGCIKIIFSLLKSDSTELQFWASSLILNLAMSSDDARERIIKDGGIGILLEMAVKESEMPQITAQASKILVMLGFTDAKLQLNLKSGVDSSIQIDSKEHSPMKHGINLITIDFLNFKISKGRAFDLESPSDAVSLLAELKNHRLNDLIIMTTQGNTDSLIKETQARNVLASLEEYGLKPSVIDKDTSWCIVAQKARGNQITPITSQHDKGSLEHIISINLAEQVNMFVQQDLLMPLLNILMSVPAGSNISKVPELEILSTLARHKEHQIVMLSTAGFMDYIAELIWCFACVETEQLSSKPLMIAHCVGAMKICHSLSTNIDYCDRLHDGPVLGAIKSFLLTACSVMLVSLRDDADYVERANARLNLFSPDEDIFYSNGTPRIDTVSSSRNLRYSSSFDDRVELKSEIDIPRNTESTNVAEMRPGANQRNSGPVADTFDDGLISPFCADPKTQGDEIQALIAQITYEKAFNKSKEGATPDEGNNIVAGFQGENLRASRQDPDGATGLARQASREELHFNFQDENLDIGQRRSQNRESRLSERSKSSRRSESDLGRRLDEYENENFDFDDFEEEDLPPIPDNDDEDLAASQGRGFFDVTRMAPGQRNRSSSAFNPNDWPTTRSGCLSRTLSEAAQRAKSPLKDIASDLEDFDEALVNLTNYALMATYFAVRHGKSYERRNKNEIMRLVPILWCVLYGCVQENRIQLGMIVASIISQICTTREDLDATDCENVKLDVIRMTSSMIISNDYLEIYNGNWTFESISATKSVSRSALKHCDNVKGWYFEVVLLSNGILQIGWTSDRSLHEPEKGLGVGDNSKSVAFDGSRCKIWNGQTPGDESLSNNYGKKWAIGDTVSCLLSIDGEASFWLNGQDLGEGLKNIDINIDWYPAISLSLDQHCIVNFGCTPFRYNPPRGYESIDQATKTAFTEIKSTAVTEDSHHAGTDIEKQKAKENDFRSTFSKSPAVLSRREMVQSLKFDLDFSPKDLLGAQVNIDVAEVLYYEVRCSADDVSAPFRIGYQSVTRDSVISCQIHGNRLFITNSRDNNAQPEAIPFHETIGCGLIWPLKKMFFTSDGIGSQYAIDLADSGGIWTESLDEIIPYFSKNGLHINFGQSLFSSHAMNLSSFRRNSFHLIYDAVLKSEEGI